MTIEIVNNPNKEGSPESLAAIDLKEMLLESMPIDVAGKFQKILPKRSRSGL